MPSNSKWNPAWGEPGARFALHGGADAAHHGAIAMLIGLLGVSLTSRLDDLTNSAGACQPDPHRDCLQPLLPFVFFSRTKGEWLARWSLVLRILIYVVLPVTMVLGFCHSVAALTKRTWRSGA